MENLVTEVAAFWRARRVFVTGHTGFKGSWLCLWLQSLGAKVTGFSLDAPTDPNLFAVAGVADDMDDIRGDVRDLDALERSLSRSGAEVVLHLAAQSLVRRSYVDPVETYGTNVMGTVNVLEAVRRATGQVKTVLIVTSDKCYENREWVWGYRENEPMGGHDPYSNSKGCAELVAAAYRDSFFSDGAVGIGSARAGNVIGGGDWASDRLIPDIVRALGLGQPVTIRNPGAIRPWQHVLEPLSGYLKLAQQLYVDPNRYASGWNFGPADADALPVEAVVRRVATLWDEGASWVLDTRPQPHEAHYLKLDCSRARQLLDWHPRLSLPEALRWTVEWYKAQRAGADMRDFCLDQLYRYQQLERA